MLTKNQIFIVIPAYNEERSVSKIIQKVAEIGHPVVVVDDGSTDKTGLKAKELRFKNLTLLSHKINLGKGAAVKTGCEAALSMGAKAIILLDADGQHNPLHIHEFVDSIRKGNDIIFGCRKLAGKAPFIRIVGNRIGASLIKYLFGIYRQDLLCGYLAFTKKVYKKIKWESPRYGIETEIVVRTAKNNLKYTEVLIDTIYVDKYKGVTILDALMILPSVIKWKLLG